jgi:hypothetical protein
VLNRRLKIALKSLLFLMALALVAGIVYEQIGRRRDRTRIPQSEDRWILVAGVSIFSVREQVRPLSSSSLAEPAPALGWESFQTEVAKYTQASRYDRAGEGWSEPGPYPRTRVAIANDLHEPLKRGALMPRTSTGGPASKLFHLT